MPRAASLSLMTVIVTVSVCLLFTALTPSPTAAQLLVVEQAPFRSRLSADQERNLCRLQLGEDNWRSRWCSALSAERADQFDQCYRGCLRDEARSRFCDLGSDAYATLPASERDRLEITQRVSERCASVCFDSVQ